MFNNYPKGDFANAEYSYPCAFCGKLTAVWTKCECLASTTADPLLPWKPKPTPPTVSIKDGRVIIGEVEIEMNGCKVDGAECCNGKWHLTIKADK